MSKDETPREETGVRRETGSPSDDSDEQPLPDDDIAQACRTMAVTLQDLTRENKRLKLEHAQLKYDIELTRNAIAGVVASSTGASPTQIPPALERAMSAILLRHNLDEKEETVAGETSSTVSRSLLEEQATSQTTTTTSNGDSATRPSDTPPNFTVRHDDHKKDDGGDRHDDHHGSSPHQQ